MDWAGQTRHELKTFIEQLALILLLQVARQRPRFPPPPPTIAQRHAKENHMASTWWLLKPQTVQVNVIGRLIGQPYYPSPSFSTLPWDCLMTLLRQARTPASQLQETTSPSIVQLIDHLLADMSRTIASSLIISRSFQTKPFFHKVNLTTGLRDEVIKIDDVRTIDDIITMGSWKYSLSERVL